MTSAAHSKKSMAMVAVVVMVAASAGILTSVALADGSDAVTDATYGTSTDIDIAPGMRYTYTPSWPSDLSVTTTIQLQKQTSLTGTTVSIATFSNGTLTVNIPSSATAGTQYHVVLKATTTDPVQTAYIYIIFNVKANLSMTVSQADVIKGTSVTITPTTSGMGTITYSATNLPSYLTLNSSTGKITGTCNTVGTVSFTLTATTSYGESISKTVSFTVADTLSISASQANVTSGTAVTITPTVKGGLGTITYTATNLPSYLTLNSSTGKITGICSTVGTVSFTLTATTSHGETASTTVTFVVKSVLSPTNSPANGIIIMPS